MTHLEIHYRPKNHPTPFEWPYKTLEGGPNGHPTTTKNICMCCADHQFNVLVTTENNVAWHRIPATQHRPELTQGWWEACHINTAHNTIDPNANLYQPDGVAIVSLNKSAHQVSSCGQDLADWAGTVGLSTEEEITTPYA